MNAFRQRGSIALTVRVLRAEIPRLSDLGLPSTIAELVMKRDGLVLVTGATGSGKSSTLAALVGEISASTPCHVITLEDPVEYLHRHGKGIVNQREIGSDTPTFADGVRAALREDPDVIDRRTEDLETASTALSAAETAIWYWRRCTLPGIQRCKQARRFVSFRVPAPGQSPGVRGAPGHSDPAVGAACLRLRESRDEVLATGEVKRFIREGGSTASARHRER